MTDDGRTVQSEVPHAEPNPSSLMPAMRYPISLLAIGCLVVWAALPVTVSSGEGLVPDVSTPMLEIVAALIIAGLGILAHSRHALGRLTSAQACALILAAAFVLRATYVLYTTYVTRQHDVNSLGSLGGHQAYILWFADNGLTLPDFNPLSLWSFYNPPLHYMIAGAWVAFERTMGLSTVAALEGVQFLTLFYSCVVCVMGYRILRLFHLHGRALIIPFAILCLHPSLVIMAGSINNDVLCLLFVACALEAALRWHREPSLARAFAVAAFAGLAVATKNSGLLVLPAVFLIFLLKLIHEWGTRERRHALLAQLIVCAVTFVPIAGFWTLWCLLRFGVSPGAMQTLGVTSPQYLGTGSYLARCLGLGDAALTPFECWDYDGGLLETNPTLGLLKTSLFDEKTLFSDGLGWWLCVALYVDNLILTAVTIGASVIGTVRALRSRPVDVARLAMVVLSLCCLVSYYVFCAQQPYVCTQNFRYVMPTLISGGVLLGTWLEEWNADSRELVQQSTGPSLLVRVVTSRALIGLTVAFCLLTAIIYLMLGTVC